MGIYCVVCLNCLFILVHTFVRKGKERELWWVKFSFPSGYQWIQDSDSHKHDRELTLAAPWWARCAAPSPGSPPSEPLHVPPTLVVSSLPPRCQPGGGDSEVECFFFQICLNARSRTGCFYIPLNWVRTYIFKLLECTKVSQLRIYMICISNLIEPWTKKIANDIPYLKRGHTLSFPSSSTICLCFSSSCFSRPSILDFASASCCFRLFTLWGKYE